MSDKSIDKFFEKDMARFFIPGNVLLLHEYLERHGPSQETLIAYLSKLQQSIDTPKHVMEALLGCLDDKNTMPNLSKRWMIWHGRTDLALKWNIDSDIFAKDSSPPEGPSNEYVSRSNIFFSTLRQHEILKLLRGMQQEILDLKADVQRLSPRPALQSGNGPKLNLD